MAGASKITFGKRGNTAWSWGHGPVIVLVHGWGGRAAQLAPLAATIAQQGYRCVAVDVTGHGDSPGDRTSWRCFIDDVGDIGRELGEVVAYVGHSAGGLASMAARRIVGLSASCFVCVCAPSHPFPPIRAIQQALDPPQSVLDAYRAYLAKQFEASWTELEAGLAFANMEARLLLCYDKKDRFVDHSEGDLIQRMCPHARLIKTNDHGHTKILASEELSSAIVAFLNANRNVGCTNNTDLHFSQG
jgi:pimeloyl-ACP methyl ester carboxylesterase